MIRFEFNGITFAKYQKFIFSTVDGLNEGETSYQTASYLEQDGQDILTSYYEPRKVTLNGYILADSDVELYALRRQLVNACNGKAKDTLTYNDGHNTYFSEAIAELPQFGIKTGFGLPFIVYFNLYNFYWKAQDIYINNVFQRTNHLSTLFTLPLIITTRTNKSIVINDGDVSCSMIIKITGKGTTAGVDGFKVINNTTGNFIRIAYNIADSEVVTIDTQEITITSSVNGNILHKVTNDSKLDLKLMPGTNEIEGINYASNYISIVAEHYNLYVGV